MPFPGHFSAAINSLRFESVIAGFRIGGTCRITGPTLQLWHKAARKVDVLGLHPAEIEKCRHDIVEFDHVLDDIAGGGPAYGQPAEHA